MPTISIILPVYNVEPYLRRCLESIAAQTFADIEILAVNDGSTDQSGAILAEFAARDARFRLFTQENAGPAAARNRALDEARGKFLMFCDGDDWYEPAMCQRMYDTITEQNVDLVMCNTRVEEVVSMRRMSASYYFPFSAGRHKMTPKAKGKMNVLLWNKIFRKDLIDRYGIRFPPGRRAEDDAFIHQYDVVATTFYCLEERLYHYVIRGGSLMDGTENPWKLQDCSDVLVLHEFLWAFLRRHQLWKENESLFIHFFCRDMGRLWPILPGKYRWEFLRRIRQCLKQSGITHAEWARAGGGKFRSPLLRGDYPKAALFLWWQHDLVSLYIKYARYTILSFLTWGRCRKRYSEKRILTRYALRRYKKLRKKIAQKRSENLSED